MFQFTRFPLPALCVQTGVTPHYGCRVYPFGHPRFNAQSAASRGLSQPLTTFIGSQCQGIHRWLFVAWVIFLTSITRCSCSLCNSQEAKGDDCDNGEPPSLARHQTSRTTPQNSLEGRSSRDWDVAASSKRKRRTPPPEGPEPERAVLNLRNPIRRRTSSECLNWELLDDSRPGGRRPSDYSSLERR